VNSVNLIGRLTKDADIRYTQNGVPVANFTVAVNRIKKDEADFINCIAFNKTAENLANYMSKGSLIGVSGSIQTRSYENKEGRRVYVTEVVANQVTFLERKKSDTSTAAQHYSDNREPFEYSNSIDISDDELPF
jgi:single-strand DNA-binding protein